MKIQTRFGNREALKRIPVRLSVHHNGNRPFCETPIIDIHGLTKRYGDFVAVNKVNFEVQAEEIFGILGPNGAGKTTLLEMVEGLRNPDSGTVRVAGVDAARYPVIVKRLIGIQLQTTALFDFLSVREIIGLFAALYDSDSSSKRINELIAMVALQEKAGSYANTLSGGQQQRLSIALALVNDPMVIFLDEPTTGLDPLARRNLWDVIVEIRKSGKTIVLTTHYMEEAETLCDRVAIMDSGQIITCDKPRNLIQSLPLGSTIQAKTSGPTIPLEFIRSIRSVTAVDQDDGQLIVRTDDVPNTMSHLLALATRFGVEFDVLTTSGATLEDVFLQLTGRRLRD